MSERLTPKEQALIEIGEGTVRWAIDTDGCHFCCRDEGVHDDDCPVGDYLLRFK